jgi:hypothetical protein
MTPSIGQFVVRWGISLAGTALVSVSLHPVEVRSAADAPAISLPPDAGPMATSRAAQMKAADYVEREFFLEGSAQSYSKRDEWTSDGFWMAVPAARAPFKVRMLVRYPAQPARFSGVVLVEWLNVSGQTEADPDFSSLHVELLRSGYAYAGVGAQSVGINGTSGLKKINTARYAELHHPGDSYSYDIYSQAGQAIRTPKGPAPLGTLTPRISRLIAAGESQSAGRMVTYVNAVHPLVNVYDGFLIHSRSGGAAPLAQDAENKSTMPLPALTRIRRDLKTPVLQVQAETDVPNFVAARQLDDDAVRTWELAGTAHADRYLLTGGGTRPAGMTCTSSDPKLSVPINDGPMTYSMRAALRHLRRWMETGTPPPAAQPLSTDGREIRRDAATGIALGGVRTPHVDVPVRTLSGVREPAEGGGFCRLFGRTDEWNNDADPWDGTPADPSPTPEPVLSTLYRSPSVYRARFDEALEKAVTNGFVLGEDIAVIRAEAAGVQWEERRVR